MTLPNWSLTLNVTQGASTMDVDTVCEANNPGSRRKLNHNSGLNAKYWSSAEWNKS